MILPEHVHLAIEAVDMRWGADRLSLCVQHSLGKSPCASLAIAVVPGSSFWFGMVPVYGYVSAAYIVAPLFGRRHRTPLVV